MCANAVSVSGTLTRGRVTDGFILQPCSQGYNYRILIKTLMNVFWYTARIVINAGTAD